MHAIYYYLLHATALVVMYRGVFTVGVVVTRTKLTLADALTDYLYVNATDGNPNIVQLARCVTGQGPNRTDIAANGELGGWYFNGTKISNSVSCYLAATIQPISGASIAGVINLYQCRTFTTANEGIYTCTMMNSAMMDQSVRLGVYFTGRSESLD